MNEKEAEKAFKELMRRAEGKIGYHLHKDFLTDKPRSIVQRCFQCGVTESRNLYPVDDDGLYRWMLAFQKAHLHEGIN